MLLTLLRASSLFFLLAALEAYSQNVSVNHLTGAAQCYIPITTISDRGVSADIGLSYYSNGILAGAPEGNAGVGWNVTGMGQVSRELRGLPDDYTKSNDPRKGWLFNNNSSYIQNFAQSSEYSTNANCSDEVADWNYLTGLNYERDTEPDVFHVNAPGLSLQFVFDGSGNPTFIPYSDNQITVYRNTDDIDSIKVVRRGGTVYMFHAGDTVTQSTVLNGSEPIYFFHSGYNFFKTHLTYKSSWDLVRITSLDGGEINYEYGDGKAELSTSPVDVIRKNSQNSYVVKTQYFVRNSVKKRQLEAITTKSLSVVFGHNYKGIVEKIEILDNTGNSNPTSFSLGYTRASSLYDNYYFSRSTRSFLASLQQDVDCNGLPPYKFYYNDLYLGLEPPYLPMTFNADGRQTDYWGYYNGNANSQKPGIFYYQYGVGSEKFRIAEGSAAATTKIGNDSTRYASPSYARSGTLNQIILPGTGSILIGYELNEYKDENTGENVSGGGVRVSFIKRIARTAGSVDVVTNYTYSADNDQTYGRLIYPPAYAFAYGDEIILSPVNMAPESGVFYEKVKESQPGNGYTLYQFSLPTVYPATEYESWKSPVSFYARKPTSGECDSLGKISPGTHTFPFPPAPDYGFANGLIAKVSVYNQAGQLVQESGYNYQSTGGTEKIIYGLKYELTERYAFFSKYKIVGNISKSMRSQWNRVMDELTPTQYLYDSMQIAYISNTTLPRTTTSYAADGTVTIQKNKYVRDFNLSNPFGATETVLGELNDYNAGNFIIEQAVYQTSISPANLLGSGLTLFEKNNLGQYFATDSYTAKPTTDFVETGVTVSQGKNKLTFDDDYELSHTITEFDLEGNAVSVSDGKVAHSGTHFGYGMRWPVLVVSNAKASQAVFSNFEGASSYGFEEPAGANYPQGRTGSKAITINGSTVLNKDDIEKSTLADTYLFSCWTKSTANRTLTLKFKSPGGSVYSTSTINYGSSNLDTWKFKEAEVDVSSFATGFTLEVSADGAITLDDVLFYPAAANVSHQTVSPLSGITSASDTEGRISFISYDESGRKSKITDQSGNLLQVIEYGYSTTPRPPLTVGISSPGGNDVEPGDSKVFTAVPTACISGTPDYQWFVDDTVLGTLSTQSFTFADYKDYDMKLRAIYEGDTAYSEVCIKSVPALENFSANIASIQVTGGNVTTNCDISYARTFTAMGVTTSGCGMSDKQFLYRWYYTCNGLNNQWQEVETDPDDPSVEWLASNSIIFDINDYFSPRTYTIKCEVYALCKSKTRPGEVIEAIAQNTLMVEYDGDEDCL